ncbi:hypothetical protein DPEC_G00336850 [Dallia pectoralis]|uniref:Uncharacterized protein n=1 Tax=Dallia pectoralis TaxID=75939 RepID=A0ACC2F7D8_DALPE|nr:hypothetical protein DPEC_G00336850 [Dallia pectoralis]
MGPKRDYFLDVTVVTALCLLCGVTGQEPEVRAKLGGVVEMGCRLPPADTGVSVPLHVVEWVRQDLDIPVLIKFGEYLPRVHPHYEGRVSLMGNSFLRVTGLLLEDQGLYECRVLQLDKTTDEARNGTCTRLSVTAPPIFTETPPAAVEALAGNPLALACVARGNPPPVVTWAKDGTPVGREGRAELRSGTLSFEAVSTEDEGDYRCIASNTEGNVSHVTQLDIKGPPVIVIPPKDTTLNITQNALLSCQAVADPQNMTYVWLREGENVYHIEPLKSRVKIMVDGTLIINSIQPDDSGVYTCMPTNGLLTPPTASANLTVRHPAQVLQMPPQTYLPTGLSGRVSCPVKAQPPLLRVDWTKDGKPVDLALYPGWSQTSEGSLLMATINDDATGVYVCTPYNSYGTMGQSEPTTAVLQDPPSLSVSPDLDYRQDVGKTLVIPCQTAGDPTAAISWSKVGPDPRAHYSVAANGSLLLQPLSKDHQGAWMCSVTNRVATVKATTLISVLGTSPHAATLVSVSPGVRQANVSWEPGFDGGHTQKFTVWFKQISLGDGEVKQEWLSVAVPPLSGYSFQVTGLVPATEYQFSVLPHNKVGTGPFSEIATVQTLNLLPRREKLEPPTSLSANRSSSGLVLTWSAVSQYPPITGFVLQLREEQGAWFNLDEEVGANISGMIVPGLSKDSVYELRLLSRRGELLSQPSPSVNVSTIGMEMYPANSRLLEVAPESLLAGVIGGVAFLCLVLVLVVGTACIVWQRRAARRRRSKKNDLLPAIYKSSPSTGSLVSSPDSVLKQKLLPNHSHYPGSTPTSSCSSSQSDHSAFGRHSEYQDKQLLSGPPRPPYYSPSRHHQPRTDASPVEYISRGPDGRFMVHPFDQASIPTSHTTRSPRRDFPPSTGVQGSASFRSEKSVRSETPCVLSVNLPPCGGTDHLTRVRAAVKHLPLHGHFYLDGDSCAKHPDDSSLYSDCNSDMYPQSGLEKSSPGYLSLKRPVQPATASTLVLQMEHERETGNLSRCLKLAQEREHLESELRKYTLERNTHADEIEEGKYEERWRDTGECDTKPQDSAYSRSHPRRGHSLDNRGSSSKAERPSSLSYIHWEASPVTSATSLVIEHQAPSESSRGHCNPPPTQCSSVAAFKRHPVWPESADRPPKPQEREDAACATTHAGLDDRSRASTGSKRDRSELSEQNKDNHRSFDGGVSRTSRSDTSVDNKASDFWRIELTRSQTFKEPTRNTAVNPTDGVEMSVDEPGDEGSVGSPAYPTMQRRHQVNSRSPVDEQDTRGQTLDHRKSGIPRAGQDRWDRTSRPQRKRPTSVSPARPVLRKSLSLGGCWNGQDDRLQQRSRSLDSRRQFQGNFLTPDAWIDSLSQENCSTLSSFRPDSLFWEPESASATESPLRTRHTEAACPPPLPPRAPGPQSPIMTAQPCQAYKGPTHIQKFRQPTLNRQQTFSPPPSVPGPSSSNPTPKKASTYPDASRWPITYQEALRSVQHTEAGTKASLPRDDREHPRPSDCGGGIAPTSLHRGYSCPPPLHASQPPQKKTTEVDEEEDGHEAEMGMYPRGVPDSAGSYSSCASQSSGRGSLEPANGRSSICLSPCGSSQPENRQETHPQDMDAGTRRKASVDGNYEWDSNDVSIQPEEQDLEGRGMFSVSLQKCPPSVNLSREIFKASVHLPGHSLASHHSEPEPETVLF